MPIFILTARHLVSSLCVVLGTAVGLPVAAADLTIENGRFWKDTSGTPIYSQGGGMLKVGDTWYWYGAKYEEAVSYAKDPTVFGARTHFAAVTAYSSKDLVNWKFEGDVIKAAPAGQIFERGAWLGRMGVVYNAKTRKYVLLTQYSSKSAGGGVLFATSDSPAGPFVYQHLQPRIENVASPTSGDQTVFVDDDGQPYLIFSNNGDRRRLYVAPLRSADFLQVEAATQIYHAPAGGREGNAMFKRDGLYYFCSSDLHGWNASRSFYMTSTSITGPYSAEKLIAGTDLDFSHVSQNGFFIPVQGSAGTTVLYAGDRWSNFAGNGHGYNIWTPLSFDGKAPVFNSLSQFSLDAAKGTWRVGAGNNYVLNPGFEADRVAQSHLTGWVTSWTSLKGPSPIVNALGGRTGRWAMTLAHTGETMGSVIQNVTAPNGAYILRAWVRSSGGQRVARVYALADGAPEVARQLDTASKDWTEITLPGVTVREGRIQVGFYSEGKDGQWLQVDDISLVRE